MWPALACPEGAKSCNDVIATSALLVLFPLIALLAFVLALLLARFVVRRRRLGSALAMLGAVLFIYYSSGSIPGVVVGFGLGLIGLLFALGRRVGTQAASA